ncbi:Chromodomain-helicase-DNA-binding protein 1-like [Sciurus carolinensis]|uniref:Chromodomain-helicase-DNA-binding protein 1-like n=1 Tax=Sciurus carolinensis TaxID=30640 RepID=A0AA41NIX7_SCICA|nr:Chromodomain-helicase-DNA-binding protein 1-like [Sciurus carolinensis]
MIALIIYLAGRINDEGPFLILCPLSVLNKWREEMERFAPFLFCVTFSGDKEKRVHLQHDLKQESHFHVLLTTYEIFISSELHNLFQPFLLRRVKAEVATELPKKTEVVIDHVMSALQKKYYKAILMKDQGAEPEPFEVGDHLIEASGKLYLLDKLLDLLHSSENCSDSGVELDNWTEVELQEEIPLQAQLQVSGS